MTLSVESKDKRVEAYHSTTLSKDCVFLSIGIDTNWLQPPITIRHSDIDSVIEALQKYKERMTAVLGSDSLK